MRFNLNSKRDIKKYMNVLEKRINYIREGFIEELQSELQVNTPKRTGKLRASYVIDKDENDTVIKNDAGYCKYVNDGTAFQKGQHFIERSIENSKAKLDAIAKDSQKINL